MTLSRRKHKQTMPAGGFVYQPELPIRVESRFEYSPQPMPPAVITLPQPMAPTAITLPQPATASTQVADLYAFREQLREWSHLTDQVELFAQAREASGNAVVLAPHYSFLPILIGRDQQPIALYRFVEVLDDVVDFDQIQEAFPTLSFGQISGALAFLRKLVQFNTRGVDIDRLEDEAFEGSPEFQAQMKRAVADQEITRVLTANQRHG